MPLHLDLDGCCSAVQTKCRFGQFTALKIVLRKATVHVTSSTLLLCTDASYKYVTSMLIHWAFEWADLQMHFGIVFVLETIEAIWNTWALYDAPVSVNLS